jgi:hypothetical protein
VTVTDRDAVGVVLALGPDDLADLEIHQLVHDAEPDPDAEREQALPRRPDELAQRLLNLRWERALRRLQGRDDLRRGVPSSWRFLLSSRTWFAPRTLPTGADEAGGPPFKVLRDPG